jgi:serine/threonine-protein phosphatase 2A regulatory subunit B''
MLIDAKAFYEYDQRESGNLLETDEYEDFWYHNYT